MLDQRTIAANLMINYGAEPLFMPRPKRKVVLKHDLNLEALKLSIDDSMAKFGRHPWKTADGSKMIYSGFSLTYNPLHQDDLDPNASSLGTPKNKKDEFFYGSIHTHSNVKNSYFDSYGFIKRTPAASVG